MKMKRIKFIPTTLFALFLILFTACSGGNKSHDDGSHTHSDGTVHQSHGAEEAPVATEQETFKVEADSTTSTANPAHDHNHGQGQLHDHGDGKLHKH